MCESRWVADFLCFIFYREGARILSVVWISQWYIGWLRGNSFSGDRAVELFLAEARGSLRLCFFMLYVLRLRFRRGLVVLCLKDTPLPLSRGELFLQIDWRRNNYMECRKSTCLQVQKTLQPHHLSHTAFMFLLFLLWWNVQHTHSINTIPYVFYVTLCGSKNLHNSRIIIVPLLRRHNNCVAQRHCSSGYRRHSSRCRGCISDPAGYPHRQIFPALRA